jgi:hypothetical protein
MKNDFLAGIVDVTAGSDSAKRHGYVLAHVLKYLHHEGFISERAFAVAIFLEQSEQPDTGTWLSRPALTGRGRSGRMVDRAIRELTDAGIIFRERCRGVVRDELQHTLLKRRRDGVERCHGQRGGMHTWFRYLAIAAMLPTNAPKREEWAVRLRELAMQQPQRVRDAYEMPDQLRRERHIG